MRNASSISILLVGLLVFGCKPLNQLQESVLDVGVGANATSPTPSPSPTPVGTPTSSPTPSMTPVSCNSVPPAKYFVATPSQGGSDSNPGTFSQPFATWEKLASTIRAGERAYIRSGTYRSVNKNGASSPLMNWQNLQGTATAKIEIFAYPCDPAGTRPTLDFGDVPPVDHAVGFQITNARYLHVKGLRITGLRQPSPVGESASGFVVDASRNTVIENIEVDHIGGYGFRFVNGSQDIEVKNCDAHHLDDRYTPGGRAWQGANGFNITGGDTSTRITFDGCRAWCISDDGFDFYSVDAFVTIKNSWAFWNGYECTSTGRIPRGDGDGFKLGPANSDQRNTVLRVLHHNLSFENKFMGYDQNSGLMRYQFYNNVSYKNGNVGYFFGHDETIAQDFRNNLSYRDSSPTWGAEINGSFNSWNFSNLGIQDSHFLSLSTLGADGPRQADGSLPLPNLLRPAPNSPLIDKGTSIGSPPRFPYRGTAPDLGAFEY